MTDVHVERIEGPSAVVADADTTVPTKRRLPRLSLQGLVAILTPVAVLIVWQLVAEFDVVDARFIPPPTALVGEFQSGLSSGKLPKDTGISLLRVGAGFLIGGSLGVVVGALAGMSRTLRALVGPVLAAMYAIPKTALAPLLILLLGFTETSKVTLLALSAFFLVEVNTVHGVLTVPRVMFEVARDTGAGRIKTLRTVAIPGTLPYIFAGLRLAWTVALIVVVFVEMKATNGGLGHFIMQSWRIFEIDRMFVGLIVLALVGWASNALFDVAARVFIPWKVERA